MAESMVERVELAMARFFEGSENGPEGTWWRIHDSEEDNRIVGRWTDRGELDAQMSYMNARAAIAAMRSPEVIEDACRRAADPKTGHICWEGISVHRAADVMDAVLGAALAEPSALGE